MNGRYFELVACRPGGPVAPLEVVGIDRLWRAVEGVDALAELRCGEVGQVQEGAFADALVRVGCLRAQQQCRRVDAAAGENVVPGDDADAAPVRLHAAFVHAQTVQTDDPLAVHQQAFGAGEIEQFATLVQQRRNAGDQHRLLGVGWAAHAAVAEVPAATHVARDHCPVLTEAFTAALQYRVVGIRRHGPGRDAEALLHAFEPELQCLDRKSADAVLAGPVLQRLRWCAKARGPVHQRGAADRTTLQDGDGAILAGAADGFLIERAVGAGFLHVEVAAGTQRAFFDEQHLVARGAQHFRTGGATCAAADDGNVGFQGQIAFQSRAVVCGPAAGEARSKQIGNRHGCLLSVRPSAVRDSRSAPRRRGWRTRP